MLVIKERISIIFTQIRFQPTDGQIHSRHLPSRRVAILTVDGNILQIALVFIDELGRLYEHSTGTTGRVINSSLEGLDNLNNSPNDTGRSIEFTVLFSA